MAGLVSAFPRISMEGRGEPFGTLARSIVGQQISVKAAASIWSRIGAVAPNMSPRQILGADREVLRRCGLSGRKVEYVIDLAAHFSQKDIASRDWHRMSDDHVIQDLVKIRGIGRWTAEMFLMFNLLRPDVLPLDDLGFQKAVNHYYFLGESASREAMRDLAECWRPWRSVATWYLWRSLEPQPADH
jgi:DNA-3-methyladenine glycosylase II